MAQNYHDQLRLKTNTPRSYPSRLSTHYQQKKQKHKIKRQALFVMKRNIDMKLIEKLYDCFILDFNPFETKKFYSCKKYDDIYITAEKGKVALEDYRHPRHLCARYPFPKTLHIKYCRRCYCYVCDIAAPCKHWWADWQCYRPKSALEIIAQGQLLLEAENVACLETPCKVVLALRISWCRRNGCCLLKPYGAVLS